jgi:hypothetical protein
MENKNVRVRSMQGASEKRAEHLNTLNMKEIIQKPEQPSKIEKAGSRALARPRVIARELHLSTGRLWRGWFLRRKKSKLQRGKKPHNSGANWAGF